MCSLPAAFRLASFGIEYVPQYAPVVVDRDCVTSRLFSVRDDHYANLQAFKRLMRS